MDVIESSQLNPEQAFHHWYYRSKFRLLRKYLRGFSLANPRVRLADIGCGEGTFLGFLEKRGVYTPEQMLGIDPAYAAQGQAQSGRAVIVPRRPADTAFDVVLLMDVLEHTDDDAALLGEAAEALKPDGYLFITVPAFQWLFSAHDRFLGHRRRYTRASLGTLLAQQGDVEVLRLHYYFATVFPLAAPIRLLRRSQEGRSASDLKRLPYFLNLILRAATYLELPLARWNTLAGLSVVAVCRKRKP